MHTSTGPTTIIDELNSIPERLRAAAKEVAAAADRLALIRKQRNELVVKAVDQAKIPQRVVAQHAAVSQAQVVRLLAGAPDD